MLTYNNPAGYYWSTSVMFLIF